VEENKDDKDEKNESNKQKRPKELPLPINGKKLKWENFLIWQQQQQL
jgi:hypothetical protein